MSELIPLRYLVLFDDFDGNKRTVGLAHAAEYRTESALADLGTDHVVVVEAFADLPLRAASIDIAREARELFVVVNNLVTAIVGIAVIAAITLVRGRYGTRAARLLVDLARCRHHCRGYFVEQTKRFLHCRRR